MTSVQLRLFAAVPVIGVALALATTSAPATLPDSCNGQVDVTLGTPVADVSGQADAGTVTIVFESEGSSFSNPADNTISEADLGGTPAAGNRFGASVVWGLEDATPSCSMVAVGAPGADGGKGKVYVFIVDEDGPVLDSVDVLTQDSPGVESVGEAGDNFGSSLHFGGDLVVSWLAVGSPNEDIGSGATADVNAGMAHVLPYTESGISGEGSVGYWQGHGAISGGPETGDHFGAALGSGRNVWSLWVGAPEEDIGSEKDAGVIHELPGSTSKLPGSTGTVATITGDTSGVPGSAEPGDHFGAVLAALAGAQSTDRQPVIGVPGENIGSVTDAGLILVAYGDKTWGSFQQGTSASSGSVDGSPEDRDRFGSSLSTYGTMLLIGVPGEDLGSYADAGQMHLMTAAGALPKLSASREQSWNQGSTNVAGLNASGDRFGSSVALSVSGAVIGVPGEDIEAAVDAGGIVFLPYVPTNLMSVTGTGSLAMSADDFDGAAEPSAGFGAVAFSITQ